MDPERCSWTSVQQVQLVQRITGAVEHTRETEKCGSSSTQLVQLSTLIFQVFLWLKTLETQRITGAVEHTRESEKCGSRSTQLVQLPTHSNIPGVSMVRNTGDLEDNTGQ